jgi:chemotaxis methyl-accepting protein methylase
MQALSTANVVDLSPLEQELWTALIRRRCGLSFSDCRPGVLSRSLRQRMQARGIQSGTAYYRRLEGRGEDERETREV